MQNTPSNSCCCAKHAAPSGEHRRGFIAQAAAVSLGGVSLLIPAAVGIAAFLNPLRQKSPSGQFMRLASLDVLPEDGTPRKVPVIADRTDAWNRYPSEPIGTVFLRRIGKDVKAFQVICPHAGCSINFESSGKEGKFFCPCHGASFDLAGTRINRPSPSPRDMDILDVEIRNQNEVWVKFETFRLGISKKMVQG
jgi:menaquinol-cytochrome c reductase iron-sulfur subunit